MLKNLKEFKLPEVEEQVLKFWKQHSIFEQSLKKNQGKKKFVFFEGPPTANGMPGIHHQLARSFKDIIPRFKAMQGFDVPRKAGWDTHGLPVELQAEKELGFSGKQDIEKYGIAEFNAKCRELVWRYREQFENATDRLGFWLDLKHPYVTYDNSYVESLWNIIAQIDKRKLLYQGHKVVPWCTRCGTALSSHELAQGYKEVEDTSVYVKFKLTKQAVKKISPRFAEASRGSLEQKNIFVLSWTTTPWTLPGNVALAVGDKIEYAAIKVGEGILIVARERLTTLFPDASSYSEAGIFTGKELLGLEYQPLFDVKPLKTKKAYKIYPADFVNTTDGTGVVHTAVMYGEDDYQLGTKVGLPQHHTVNEQGHFTKEVKQVAGMYAKGNKAETAITEHLTATGTLLKTEKYKHEYPHCWRCHTPLLYYARTSWFVGMSQLRKQLLAGNKQINWIPAHIKDGRFGEWLKDAKDWNFSRERYWGTPLPVWRSSDHKSQLVVSSLADIKKYALKSGNQFFGMRHGEATHNLTGRLAGGDEKVAMRSELTPKGIKQIEAAAKKLKKAKINLIVASPYYRSQQSAKILAKALKVKVIYDKRLGEVNAGILNWQSIEAYWKFYREPGNWLTKAPEKGESHADVLRRVMECVRALDKKFKKKKILIISHGDPLRFLNGGILGYSDEELRTMTFEPSKAQVVPLGNPVLPYNDDGRLDVHRPYIDRVVLEHPKTKKPLHRVREVCDVWFDSGAMPYAQAHYPFDTKTIDYPADYICEAIDQTRGWFYTLLAISTLLKREPAYRNVICLGHIRDKNGQKMSKSKGNIVDPMMIMNTYGADVLRWYFFTANDPGDPKDFDEADLTKITRRFVLILYNSFLFWNSYGQGSEGGRVKEPSNVLDRWIIARLHEITSEATKLLERYEVGKAALLLEQFTDDLSRWYIRRSRDRFQSSARGDASREDDYREASAVLHESLITLSKLLAPFMPFFSEALYKDLGGDQASVHLDSWPVADSSRINKELLRDMTTVRTAAAGALALRASAAIKVRQPLAKLILKDRSLEGKDELLKIILDEVNVKEVVFDSKLAVEGGMQLDTVITQSLREEGLVRELTRAIQGLRASANYNMSDEIVLMLAGEEKFTDLVQRYSVQLKKAVNAKTLELKKGEKADAQQDSKLENWAIWIGVRKA